MGLLRGDDARQSDSEEFPREAIVNLAEGESAWHPTTTLQHVSGPITARYLLFADGGVTLRLFG